MKLKVWKKMAGTAILGSAVAMAAAASAVAMDETSVRGSAINTNLVSYKRSDLLTEDGRARIEQRIRRAAEDVCGEADHRITGSLSVSAKREACYDRAVNEGMSQLNAGAVASAD